MRISLLAAGLGALLGAIWLLSRRVRPQGATPSEDIGLQGPGREAVLRARKDIEEHGWHIVMVYRQEGGASFLYTAGLWKTYRHPELVLFSPAPDPSGMVGPLRGLVERVQKGEAFEAGKSYDAVFGTHRGAVRQVRPVWMVPHLGITAGAYSSFDFPAVQVFWPDKGGKFPWEPDSDPDYSYLQPLLYEQNLLLARVGLEELRIVVEEEDGREALERSLAELFVEIQDPADESWLADWRWKLTRGEQLFRVTLFGDAFVRGADGTISFLDTGTGELEDVARDEEEWKQKLLDDSARFFHTHVLGQIRALDYPLSPRKVYSWRHSLSLGGRESVDNVDRASVRVHLSFQGRTLEALQNVPPGARVQFKFQPLELEAEAAGAPASFAVVTNEEEQYSIWPVGRELPSGWKREGFEGSKQACLDHIEKVWVDKRPKSLREQLDRERGSPP